MEALLAFENSEGAENFLGWALGPERRLAVAPHRMGLSIQGIKTRLDSRMSPLWLCPRLENCDQGSFVVKKECFLAIAELISLVLPPGRARKERPCPGL